MAYQLITFDSAALPLCLPQDPLSTGIVTPGIVNSAGAAFDRYGTRQVLPQSRIIHFRGRYNGSSTALQTQLDALRAKIGVRGYLVRKDQSSTETKVYARLLTVDGTWTVDDNVTALLDMRWETIEPSWRAGSTTTATGSVGGNTSIVNNGTAPVVDPIVTVTASGGNLVDPTFTIAALGVYWTFTGTVSNTKSLVIDCGAMTVKNDGTNAYSGFALTGSHTARGWMPLSVTTHTLAVAGTGAGSVSVAFVKRYF